MAVIKHKSYSSCDYRNKSCKLAFKRTHMPRLHKRVLSSACQAALVCAAMRVWNWAVSHLKQCMNIILKYIYIIIIFKSDQPGFIEPESSICQIYVVYVLVLKKYCSLYINKNERCKRYIRFKIYKINNIKYCVELDFSCVYVRSSKTMNHTQ